MSSDLTSANSVLSIGVTGLVDTPVQLGGFAQDDAYSVPNIEVSENLIGVDGVKSSGFIPTLKEMEIVLQADSDSNDFFESWYQAQQQSQSQMNAFGTVYQPSIGKSYALTNGTLKGYSPLAQAKKILQPRKFSIVWGDVSPAPTL